MKRRDWMQAALAGAVVGTAAGTGAQPAPSGAMKALGQGRYQIGAIVVDTAAKRFTVPGKLLASGRPLEYLATAPRGMKGYESLLELQSGGTEFNLACILLGLERDAQQVPPRRYREAPKLVGPRLRIELSWGEGAQKRRMSAAQALLNADAKVDPEAVEWVYVGSPASDGQAQFMAEVTGILIGFSHDANSLIESTEFIGRGAYGSVRGSAQLPPNETPIELHVEVLGP